MEYPVHSVDDAYDACHPETPLEFNDSRYVDLTQARGGENFAQRMAERVRRTKHPNFLQQLISGHRGCGKSTELLQLQTRLQGDNFFTVYVDVEEVLDLGEIKYLDLLFSLAKAIEEKSRREQLNINSRLLDELERWFGEYILAEDHKLELESSLKSEFSLEPKLPMLARILASISAQIKTASSRREELRLRLKRELTVFIDRLNVLIGEVRRSARAKGFIDLVVIVDGLEKMQYREEKDGGSNFKELFIHHKEQLKAPHCHIFYTVPITLAFDENVRDAFPDEPVILPMVNQNSEVGRTALFEIVQRRVAIAEVFDHPTSVERLALMSGGSVRDLLRLVRLACEGMTDKITAASVESAIKRMIKEFDRALHKDDLEPLKLIAASRELAGTKAEQRLLYLRMVHEYENGERWADLHPILREVRRVKDALASAPRTS